MARFFVPAGDEFAYRGDVPTDVEECLRRFSDEYEVYAVFLGAQFGRQADVIVFTRNAVHVIEIKDRRGTIVVDEKNRWLEDGKPIVNWWAGREENPLLQVRSTAKVLEAELGKIYKKAGKSFRGKVFPYVLIPHANEATRSNLQQVKGWEWVLTSLGDAQDSIVKRDQGAIQQVDFAFDQGDIDLIAQSMRMVEKRGVSGIPYGGATPERPPQPSQEPSIEPQVQQARIETVPRKARIRQWREVLSLARMLIGIIFLVVFLIFWITMFWRLPGPVSSPATWPFPTPAVSQMEISPERMPTSLILPSPTSTTALPEKVLPPFNKHVFLAVISVSRAVPEGAPTPLRVPYPTPIISPQAEKRWSASKGGLTLTVDRIETTHGFQIWMTAVNQTDAMLMLPLFGYFFVIDDLGNQYTADPFSSTFPMEVAPGATVSGYAEMERPLDSRATRITVMFTQVFGSLSVQSIRIEDIPVR